ncbi:hypothetical protein [Candidatus Protofrankia californiensis]|uniref:hypothetical protein n=1 Tax=Candidatus Protofrankia californiensis TaxID=1839754 RepID=UPI0032049B8F
MLYTVLPLVIVAGLFSYTARDEIEINKMSGRPDVTINVIGFRWNWQFRYPGTGANSTAPLEVIGRSGEPAVLMLPQGRSIRFVLPVPRMSSASFWMPASLFKRDMIPGRMNQLAVTIGKTSTFKGRCAEFCGVDHNRMIFYVAVVPGAEYDRFVGGRTRPAGLGAAGRASSSRSASGPTSRSAVGGLRAQTRHRRS